ncbi:MAG TPA: glycine zipper 2TM domain-containing protein [Arenimonas sp.]|uniref:glycine zipper 2TM domain-containing protein n=1 Tax=Arenimonas sp. TaxID=1872635 RepID=UPI002D7F1739|nr:glycine zipper 2TM domain-containing protein [Arenimonas sp.]HEU0151740.1 glycine zipper 2TM domain-containing protein [Arenimonas sp.]
MNRLVSRTLVLAVALAAGTASAQDYYEPDYGYADDRYDDRGYDERGYDSAGPAYDFARVTRVEPIVERSQPVSRRECWSEPAPSYAGRDRYDPYAAPRYARRDPRRPTGNGAVLGAIVGGVLGNSVGNGDGRQAATVVGAVLGGAIGNDIERTSRERAYRGHDVGYAPPQDVERCRIVTERGSDRRVVGYRVGYEYAGREYETITDYHPGSELRVRVDVTPEG